MIVAAMWPLGFYASNKELFEFFCTALLCPFVGYLEFLHVDWLRQILSWQTSFGCWGSTHRSEENVLTRVQPSNKVVRRKRVAAGDKHYPLKARANSAVGDFRVKRNGMRRLQAFDYGVVEQFGKRRQELTAKRNRTIRKKRVQHGVTLMTTVFVRRRPPRNHAVETTKELPGFLNERLLLTETSDRVRSALPLPGKFHIRKFFSGFNV